jgi:hypothetical protein
MVIFFYDTGPGCEIRAVMMRGRLQAAAGENLSMTILRSPRDLLGLYDSTVARLEAGPQSS